jgi:hypothetical protein
MIDGGLKSLPILAKRAIFQPCSGIYLCEVTVKEAKRVFLQMAIREIEFDRNANIQDLPDFESPLNNIKRIVYNSLVLAVPSRANEIVRLVESYSIGWQTEKDPTFRFSVTVKDRNLKMSLQSLEFLWCTAYCSWHIDQFAQKRKPGESPFIEFRNGPLEPVGELLNWSIKNINGGVKPWPEHLPVPNDTAQGHDGCVNRIFAVMLAWVLLHEVGHIELIHTPLSITKQEEKAADQFATQHIFLDSMNLDPLELLTRIIGTVHAVMALLICEILNGKFGDAQHPPAYERMDQQIKLMGISENHPSLVYATNYVGMFLKWRGIDVGDVKDKSELEILSDFFFALHDLLGRKK